MTNYTISWMERKTSSKGNNYITATLEDSDGKELKDVAIFSSFKGFSELMPGSTVQGVLESKVYRGKESYVLKNELEPPQFARGSGGSGIKAAQERKGVMIKEAQERKNESIAYHGSIKNAIEFLAARKEPFDLQDVFTIQERLLERWRKYEASGLDDKHNAF